LADPRNPEIKDIINSRVKFREAFRPYAPSVLKDHITEIFERDIDSPFMLLAVNVKEDKRTTVPGITHVDGSARIQTVTDENNGIYAQIIREFYQLSGVPLLLNTSFNVKGEPIVETPEDAINCYLNTELDFLIMENYLVSKK
jgi:carbamoyltransferase